MRLNSWIVIWFLTVVVARGASFSWQTNATEVALLNKDKTVWRLVFDRAQPKVYFHPLSTVDGKVLTALRPADHPWHRGLWWSWKYINGLNYWEEDRQTGKSQGVNEFTGVNVSVRPDSTAHVVLTFSYHPPEKPTVLSEIRTLDMSCPDANGSYRIDWTSVFTVGDLPLKFERTPPREKGGASWGGYAGLSLRFPPGIKGWSFRTSEHAKSAMEGNGKGACWADFSGPETGIAVFDHPSNVRHPSPWYLNQELPYFSPALLFDGPLDLAPRQELKLHYRILVHSKPMSEDTLKEEWQSFGK